MKALKYFLSAVILIATIWSCSDEEFGSIDFVSTATAPGNVAAFFNVTQDNTGTVTITPNGDGAVSYEVYFGDNTAEPTKVVQGKSVTHVYAEGNYQVKIIATNITGIKTESVMPLVVSFKAPENLEVVITNDLAISRKVNVTASADFAILFDVYFGEPGNDTPVSANNGGIASYVYAEAGTYTIRVVSKSAAIETTEYTQEFEAKTIQQPLASAATPPTRNEADYISIYGENYTNVAGTNFNPDWGQSGQGSSFNEFDLNGDKMLQYIKLSYQGVGLGETIDVSGMEYLHMDVWTADVDKIETSLINGVDGNSTEKPVWATLTADKWTSINIPISEFTDQGLTVDQIFQLKFVGDGWAAGTVFIDNIYFWKTPSEEVKALIYDDFEGNGNISTWFGDACGMDNAFANPQKNADNNSATVLEYNDTGGQYANVRFDAASNFDLVSNSVFTLKIYVPSSSVSGSQPQQISLKLQDGTVGAPWETQTEIIKTIVFDQWQTVTFDFATDVTAGAADPLSRTDFNRVVLQVNAEGNNDTVIAYLDDFSYGVDNGPADTAPFAKDDFEGNGTITTWAGDACGMDNAFANPQVNLDNNSATVLEYNDTGGQYANIRFDVTPNFDLTAKSKFSLKIYVPSSSVSGSQPQQISLKLQDGTVGAPWETQIEIIKTIVFDQWQTVTFDFATDKPAAISRTDFNRVVLQVNSENNTDTVIAYIDDFNYHN